MSIGEVSSSESLRRSVSKRLMRKDCAVTIDQLGSSASWRRRGGSQRRQRILQLVVEAAEKLAVGLAQLFLAGFQPVGVLSFSAASPGEGDPSAQAEKQPGGGEQSRKRELHKEVAGLARNRHATAPPRQTTAGRSTKTSLRRRIRFMPAPSR